MPERPIEPPTDSPDDDELSNVTASPDDVAYECGWHDGTDYGYRLAERELTCPQCGRSYADAAATT